MESQNKAGRPKGSPNKITRELREMILGALADKGGQEYFAKQADENPTAFMTLLGKILPTQVTGLNDGPLRLEAVVSLAPEEAYKRMLG